MKKFTLLNNFLTTDTRDGAIRINNSLKITRPIFNLTTCSSYNEFIHFNNSEPLYLKQDKNISDELSKEINNSSDISTELSSILEKYEIFFSKTKIETLLKTNDTKKIIDTVLKEYNNSFKQIKVLSVEAKKRKMEEGIWSLYLCHFFVKGKLNDGNYIKAPLVLFPVDVKLNEGKISLHKLDEPIYNEKLNLALEENYAIKLNETFEENLYTNGSLPINKILSIYKESLSSINVDFDVDHDLEKFVYDVSEMNDVKGLQIDYSSCISLLDPTGGKLKKDLLEILEKKENPFQTYSIMKTNDEIINNVVENDSILEMNGTLNLYQKYAVASSLQDNCIIYGPPGTGKSEVISNIVLNILYNNKSALIVSEKKAALDVLHKRLKALSQICLCAYDMYDSTTFYKKILDFQNLLTKTFQEFKIENWEKKYQELKDNFYYLNKIGEMKIHNKDYSMIAMILQSSPLIYDSKTKDIIDAYDDIITNKKITIEDGYNLFLKLKEFATSNREILSLFLENHFEDFYLDDLNKIIEKFGKSKDKEYLMWNYVVKQKVGDKTIFSLNKNHEKLRVSPDRIYDFILGLKSFNIHKLNAFAFGKSSAFDISEDNFIASIVQKQIASKLEKNKFISLQEDFLKYIDYKISISNSNDEKVLNIYIKKFKEIYNQLSQPEKEEIDNLFAEAKMNRKPNINVYASKYFSKLKLIFPIWLINPTRSAIIIPNKKGIFDYGIFDEASQIFLERGFPIVYRSKFNIIAGDDKQLKPTDFFKARYESDENSSLDDAESLLERAKLCNWPTYYLKNHYRCESSQLIEFSSTNFYDNNLEFITKNGSFTKSLVTVDVDGKWENETNITEVNKVIELLKENVDNFKTIMVITLNKKQLELLEKTFIKEFASNQEMINKYDSYQISFKNIENVQGHESDLVILSIGYGFNNDNKLLNSFGPITQKDGSNRLNVAITRAKEKLIVIKSFKASDMKINTENKDAYIFYKYIVYVEKMQDKKIFESNDREDKMKLFEKEALDYILANIKGQYKISKNLNFGSCKIDCAIFDNDLNKMLLGINFNRTYKVNDWKTTLENLYRNKFISDRGYNLIEIDEIEWYFKKNIIINLINDKISGLKG